MGLEAREPLQARIDANRIRGTSQTKNLEPWAKKSSVFSYGRAAMKELFNVLSQYPSQS